MLQELLRLEVEQKERETANREEHERLQREEWKESQQSQPSPWQEELITQPIFSSIDNSSQGKQIDQMRKSIDLKKKKNEGFQQPDDSAISEAGVSNLHAKDMQNPQGESQGYGTQGEEEEMKQEMLDFAANKDPNTDSLARLTKGGVAAVNNQAQHMRSETEKQSQ